MPKTSKSPKAIALLLLLQSAGLVGLLSLHRFPHLIRVVGRDIHSTVTTLTEAASLIISIALTLIARGIAHRRKRAWHLAISLQGLLFAIGLIHNIHRYVNHRYTSHLVFGAFGISHLVLEVLILALLIKSKKIFNTVTDPHTRVSDLIYFVRVSLLSLIIGIIIVYLDSRYFLVRPSILQIAEITIKGFFGISGPLAFSAVRYQERLETILLALGTFIAVTSIGRVLRPVDIRVRQSKEARIALKNLLSKYPSHDSLGYFALRDDKSLIWASNNKAVIAYSVKQGVMIASGDPLGDPECWPSAITNFLNEADRHAWIPAVYGCSEYAGEIWQRESGLEAFELGDEAVVLVDDYTVETPQMKNVRQTLNRARKEENIAHTEKIADLDIETLNEFARLAEKWRRGGDERGFAMALDRLCSPEDSDAVITWATNNGEYVAILQFAPWGVDGLSLDLMRRAPESSPGINELLIHTTIEYAREHGIKKLSLNFATFRSVFERGERLGAGPITRFNHRILKFASRFVQMESLYRFNAKFQPVWEPRFLLFPSVSKLAKVSVAVLQIESFIPDSPLSFIKGRLKK
mgnify:CR=1 FL=1